MPKGGTEGGARAVAFFSAAASNARKVKVKHLLLGKEYVSDMALLGKQWLTVGVGKSQLRGLIHLWYVAL